MYYILALVAFVITLAAQLYVKSVFNKYKQIKNKKLITGAEVARNILKSNGLEKLYVVETSGELTDHYDHRTKTIRLSSSIYNGESIASSAVAAHEVGHAIQDKEGYKFMKFRSFIFPLANLGSKFGYIAVIIGLVLGWLDMIYFGIILLAFILLFQLVTLPVEFNASKLAEKNLKSLGLLTNSEIKFSKKVLTAAAFTYVASALATILQILRLVLMSGGRRD